MTEAELLAPLLERLTAQVTRLGDLLERQTMASIQLPLSVRTLNEMINAVNIPGTVQMGVWKLSVLVPAGQTVTVNQPVLPGTVTAFAEPLGVAASYYSPGIVAQVLVDDHQVTVAQSYAVTGEDKISMGQHYFMERGMTGVITNNTATPSLITFTVEALAINSDFFSKFYRPLLDWSYDQLRRLASEARALGKGVS
ncbi:MAG TPA: hypothetical protein VGK74_22220 [Symbiobacteriaceae bacterium]